jgi:hypothetical protein
MQRVMITRLSHTGFRSLDQRRFARGRSSVTPFDDGGGDGGGGDGGGGGGLGDIGSIGTDVGGLLSGMIGGGFPGLTNPQNIVHNMQQGMSLSSAMMQTLSTAFPGMGIKIAISSLLKLNYQDAGVYQNITQYAQYIKKLSQSMLGAKNYGGVKITSDGDTVTVTDIKGITSGQVAAADLIGQPTWINKEEMHCTTVMRSDLKPGMDITLPSNILFTVGPIANQLGSASPQRTNTSFTGSFRILKVTHVGDLRNPDGAFWSSNYECSVNHPGDDTSNASQTNSNASQTQNPQSQAVTPPSTNPPQVESDPTTPLPAPQGSVFNRSMRRY